MIVRGSMRANAVLVLACAFLIAGCANRTPIALKSRFTPPAGWNSGRHAAANACHVGLVSVRDTRDDAHAAGELGGRPIGLGNPEAWLRSGFKSLDSRRLSVTDGAAGADLLVDVVLLKAYVMSVTSDKVGTVVFKVRYSRGGAVIGERIYRGSVTSWNWGSGAEEAQSVFDRALADALKTVRHDMLKHCAAPPAK